MQYTLPSRRPRRAGGSGRSPGEGLFWLGDCANPPRSSCLATTLPQTGGWIDYTLPSRRLRRAGGPLQYTLPHSPNPRTNFKAYGDPQVKTLSFLDLFN